MPSRLDSLAANDFARGMPEVMQTVIRRIGGLADRTEEVEAVVEFDEDGGGYFTDARGDRIDFAGKLEVAADQTTTADDTWVINDVVYKQHGESTSKDGGSQTINLTRRKGRTAAEPKVRSR